MRVLQIGSDRSKQGSIVPGSTAFMRQEAHARALGALDDISFTLRSDGFTPHARSGFSVHPTRSLARIFYGLDALRIARTMHTPDVVSAQDPFEAGVVAWIVARMKGVPLYVQAHTDFLAPAYLRHSLLNRIRVLTAGFVLRRAARIRAVSGSLKQEMVQRYAVRAPISVLPVFVDVERFRFALPDPVLVERFAHFSQKALVVSRLEPEKNIQLAIRAFDESAPEGACLIILGDGSLREDLQELAGTLKSAPRIFFEGSQDPAPYYQLADVVLITSRYEGYGLVIVEALAAGKPVLSTDVGAARELGAIITSEEEFGEALAQWFQNGSREGHLQNYPYGNAEEYIRKYRDDIAACASSQTV